MYPRILHIYGPIWINSYGLMISLGVLSFVHLATKHPIRKAHLSKEAFLQVLAWGVFAALIGGRLLFALMSPEEFAHNPIEVLYPWEGGFSLLGGIIGLLIFIPLYFRPKNIPALPILDLVAIFGPLIQAISRIGCFLAGCCSGTLAPVWLPWAVRYTHPESLAPLGLYLHPTQLYSSMVSFGIFLFMVLWAQKHLFKPGQLLFTFLSLEGLARFMVDFWRGDRSSASIKFLLPFFGGVSSYQLISIGLFLLGIGGLWWITFHTTSPSITPNNVE